MVTEPKTFNVCICYFFFAAQKRCSVAQAKQNNLFGGAVTVTPVLLPSSGEMSSFGKNLFCTPAVLLVTYSRFSSEAAWW